MPKQMRFVVAGGLLLVAAMIVWALRIRPAAETPAATTTDEVSTFAQRPARAARGAASARSTPPANASRSGGGATTPPGPASDPAAASSTGSSNVPAVGRGSDPASAGAAGMPLEGVTVAPTYEASDADVTAPVLLSPLVPRPLAQPRPGLAGAVRILINEDGRVESVHATVEPKTMSEAILITNALSTAKTWRFQPATRNGKPVRYSLLFPLNRF